MAAVFRVSSSLYTSIRCLPSNFSDSHFEFHSDRDFFSTGSPLGTTCQRTIVRKATTTSIRCEQGNNEGNGLDVWLGRLAMVGFAVAISVEISMGKGLLENFGLNSPLPTVALAVTAPGGRSDSHFYLPICL